MSTEAALSPVTSSLPSAPATLLMPTHVAAVVPFQDHDKFTRLSLDQQKRVSLLIQIFREMATSAEGVVVTSARLAALHTGQGFSSANLRTLYYKFKKKGWTALAKIYKGPSKLPKAFVEEVRRRIESNAVSSRAAITALRYDWAEGKSIPGYGTWRDYFHHIRPLDDVPERFPLNFYPPGWSNANLYTLQSSAAERALKRQGFAAAKRYLPHVMRDLSKLRFLELIVIDDFETDQLVQAWNPETRRWQICRCAGLLAIDAATRTKLAIGLKPRFTDDDGKKMSLTRADVQSLLYEVFRTHGMPVDYRPTILCENAAAAITSDFELALELLLGVQVARTGLIHEKTLRNGFVQSGGKPWEKPWIESMFRLMHSTAGALPGQKGANYQLKPADLEAKLLYSEKLLNTEGLPHEVSIQLRVPFLKVDEFLAAYDAVFQRMEDRTDHKLQGFQEDFMYELPDGITTVDAASLALMEPDVRTKCTPLPYVESPRMRRARLAEQCVRQPVAEHVLACLLLTPKKVELRNHRVAFIFQGKSYVYANADSPVMKLAEGTELLGYFDQGRPGVLYVTDLKGRYVGPVSARGRIDIRDTEAIGAEQAEVSRLIRACVFTPVGERHAAENDQLALDRAHNAALVAPYVPAAPEKKGISAALALGKSQPRAVTSLGHQLAASVAASVTDQEEATAQRAAVRARANALSAQDMADFSGGAAPVQGPGTAEDSGETLADYT